MGSRHKSLPNVSVVHPHVIRILGQNPSAMTLQGTNSYLIGDASGPRILIDTTGGDKSSAGKYVEVLKTVLQNSDNSSSSQPPISEILLTHWHPDHTQGIAAVQDLIRNLSPSYRNYYLDVYKSPEGPNLKTIGYYGGEVRVLTEMMSFTVPGTPSITLQPLFTPGHSVDHMCFAMLMDGNVECVFVGDLLLGFGTSIVLDLPAYMHSLKVLRDFVVKSRNPRLHLLPAHGEVITDPLGKIDDYIASRRKLIDKTRDGIIKNPENKWLDEEMLAQQIYPQTAKKLMAAALNNLRQCLFWLQTEEPPDFTIANPIRSDTKETRCENDYKAATAIVRPGYFPDILYEAWMWKWTSNKNSNNINNHTDHSRQTSAFNHQRR